MSRNEVLLGSFAVKALLFIYTRFRHFTTAIHFFCCFPWKFFNFSSTVDKLFVLCCHTFMIPVLCMAFYVVFPFLDWVDSNAKW